MYLSNPIHRNTKCHHYFHWPVAPVCWIVKLDLKFLPSMHLHHLTVWGVTEGMCLNATFFSIIQFGQAFEELV